jgi:penicillin G amidase
MRRHAVPCARLLLSALWRRMFGPAWAARPPAGGRRLRGLAQDVRIRRDEAGIAHIFAESIPDLGFGVGVAMAQDRLWQMDAMRRLACGRLAELAGDRRLDGGGLHLAGPSLLPVDQLYRSLRFREIAEAELSQVGDEGRGLLDGFARGVNAWVGQCRPGDLPPEFLLAGIDPEPWRPEDSLVIGKLIGWLLSLAFVAKPILAALAADPVLQRLRPPGLAGGPCIVGPGPAAEPPELDLRARRALGLLGPGIGSNSWVVGGSRTASGKPILCNDPHLVFGLPALWYPVALTGPTHRVIGVTMAGIPGVLIGRNDRVAWGITAAMADDGDFYRETLDAAGTRYLRDGEWKPVEAVEATFRVRGRAAPVLRTLRYVRHEGVRCPLLPACEGEATNSYRWVGFEAWRGLDALLAMNRAGNLQEFASAVEAFAVPAQNLVAADTTGAFGYFCTGKFPRRERVGEATPVLDGNNPDHAWGGYLSWAEQPKALNPEAGVIVTANNRVARDLPRALAGGFWEPPYRATRIASLLGDCPKARLQDMARVQADVVSLQAAGVVASLVRSARPRLTEPRARRAADLLLAWNHRMDAESSAAALYHLFYHELLQRRVRPLLDTRVPGLFRRYLSTLHLAVPAVDTALLTGDPALFPSGAADVTEECLTAAWEAAVARLGSDPATWRWGDLHRLTLYHVLGRGGGAAMRLLTWLFRLNRGPFPQAGDGMTINLGAFLLTTPFATAVGPSYRQIVDLGAPEASRWIIAGGASGDPRSRHYADQLSLWRAGETRPMRFLDAGGADSDVLRLTPAGADCASTPCVL